MDIELTIERRMRDALSDLTRTERQLAMHILGHYPMSALGSISALAKAAEVSTPTVVRLVRKLGFRGYPDYRKSLRAEVETMLVTPLARDKGGTGGHILDQFADRVVTNLQATLALIDRAEFDAAAALLADPKRRVYALGGRVTHALADYFVTLMTVARPDVTLIPGLSSAWPPALLDMKKGDILVVFDIRRYENTVLQITELAREQGAEVILITDRWVSPAHAHARCTLACQIEAPSPWDSTVPILAVVETLLAAVQGLTWEVTEARLKQVEALHARSRLFRTKT